MEPQILGYGEIGIIETTFHKKRLQLILMK